MTHTGERLGDVPPCNLAVGSGNPDWSCHCANQAGLKIDSTSLDWFVKIFLTFVILSLKKKKKKSWPFQNTLFMRHFVSEPEAHFGRSLPAPVVILGHVLALSVS